MRRFRDTRLEILTFAVVLALAFSSLAAAQAWAG